MPYVSQQSQEKLSAVVSAIDLADISNPGELNFLITSLLVRYIEMRPKQYTTFNDVIGALTASQAEFIRRVVNPYEEQKMYDINLDLDPYRNM